MTTPTATARTDIHALATQLFDAERAKAAAQRLCTALRADVVASMEATIAEAAASGDPVRIAEARRLEIVGQGLVTYIESGSSELLDGDAAASKIEALGARLRELGVHNVDDVVPMKTSRRAASVKVTLRP